MPFYINAVMPVSHARGNARHCNCLGDSLSGTSFSLPCGVSPPVPYSYPIYLLILLLLRRMRGAVKLDVRRSKGKSEQNTVDLFPEEYWHTFTNCFYRQDLQLM
ncbi:hypothetical protein Ancab_014409 [Ancistrocladus abbreviatus]